MKELDLKDKVAIVIVVAGAFGCGAGFGSLATRIHPPDEKRQLIQAAHNCSANISGDGNQLSSIDCGQPEPCTGAATATGDGAVANTGVIGRRSSASK